MTLTIDFIAKNPKLFHYEVTNSPDKKFLLRPLEHINEPKIIHLIDNLSEKTKLFYSYHSHINSSSVIAKEMCEAINKYDKVRFVLENESADEIIGLFEFSLDIPSGDLERFQEYTIQLSSKTDCRIAPLLRDDYQSQGLATSVLPIMTNIARKFGRKRIILWGGVRQDNPQAIRFYEKNGFEKLGSFVNENQTPCYDMILKL